MGLAWHFFLDTQESSAWMIPSRPPVIDTGLIGVQLPQFAFLFISAAPRYVFKLILKNPSSAQQSSSQTVLTG